MIDLSALSDADLDRLACEAVELEPVQRKDAPLTWLGPRLKRQWATGDQLRAIAAGSQTIEQARIDTTPECFAEIEWWLGLVYAPVSRDASAKLCRAAEDLGQVPVCARLDYESYVCVLSEGGAACANRGLGEAVIHASGRCQIADSPERAIAKAVVAWGLTEGRIKLESPPQRSEPCPISNS